MANVERTATTVWEGDLAHGNGVLSLKSGAAPDLPVTWASRTERSDGKTSPEELIAAAHSSCLAMNLSGVLAAEDLVARSIAVRAEATLGPDPLGGFAITGIAIVLRAEVDGVDAERFADLARTAERTCPVTKALAGTTITLDAALA
jgi:osmotically inducible protein OsmC